MPLTAKRNADETWRQAVARISDKHGLQIECLELFDAAISRGDNEADAAWDALYAWDCLEYEENLQS